MIVSSRIPWMTFDRHTPRAKGKLVVTATEFPGAPALPCELDCCMVSNDEMDWEPKIHVTVAGSGDANLSVDVGDTFLVSRTEGIGIFLSGLYLGDLGDT